MAKRSTTRSSKRRVGVATPAAPNKFSGSIIDDALATENKNNDVNLPTRDDDSTHNQGPSTSSQLSEVNNDTTHNNTSVNNKIEEMYNNLQSSISDNLISIISQPENLLTTLLMNDDSDDEDSDEAHNVTSTTRSINNEGSASSGGGSSNNTQQQMLLLQTSSLLFQYIEQLADMDERLKEIQKQKKLNEYNKEENDDEDVSQGKQYESSEGEEGMNEQPCTLSGLPTLYTGQSTSTLGTSDVAQTSLEDALVVVDAETLWGQVDLQNNALLPILKRLIKKLTKRTLNEDGKYTVEDMVRILDMGDDMSDDNEGGSSDEEEEEEDDGSSDEGGGEWSEEMSMGSAASNFDDKEKDTGKDEEETSDDEDSDARRIRIRMEKAMADMDEDDEESLEEEEEKNEEDNIDKKSEKQQKLAELTSRAAELEAEDEDLIDPTREEMRDGFFDLHEMEAFADEEEEMLPDDAYGDEMPGGMGEDSDGSSDGEGSDEDDDPLSKRFEPTTVRRKKYRADDEVEALYELYEEGQDENNDFDESDDEDNGGVDASTMTAADFFGKPNKKLIQSYKAKHDGKKKEGKGGKDMKKSDSARSKKVTSFADDDDDADSWDEHNFEDGGMDWKDMGDDDDDEEEDGGEGGSDEEEKDQIDEEYENEEELMKDNQKLSAHELQSKKLQEQTLQLEHDLISEKPWKMLGEAKGTDRAQDSLLDSTPEFEVAFKPPPLLTQEHTTDIEEMIKRRIIDEDYDDVVPRELPDIGAHKRGGEAPEVSQEKSKLGLGELYEREYLKKTTGFDRTATEKQTEEDEAKDEMKRLFANLCSQLDALSNYHFAPRPVADEADVQNREDVPAIAMEEVLPLHVSQSRGVAPEEVYGTGKGKKSVLKGESELDQAERKRLRRAKKAARRKERKEKQADEKLISKLQPGLGLNNPYEKRKLREELQMARASGKVVVASDDKAAWEDEAAIGKEYQTSTKFFAKMQESVARDVHGDGEDGRKKKKRKGEAGQTSSVYRL